MIDVNKIIYVGVEPGLPANDCEMEITFRIQSLVKWAIAFIDAREAYRSGQADSCKLGDAEFDARRRLRNAVNDLRLATDKESNI